MGKSFSRLYTMDADAEENGKWFFDILGDGSDVNVRVRRFNSQSAMKIYQELLEGAKEFQDDKGKLPQDKDMELMYVLVGKALLVDWGGVLDDDEQEIPFTQEKAIAFCEQFKDFRGKILEISQKMENFRGKTIKAVAKN